MDKDKILPPVILTAIIFLVLQIVFRFPFWITILAIIAITVIQVLRNLKIETIGTAPTTTPTRFSSLASKVPKLSDIKLSTITTAIVMILAIVALIIAIIAVIEALFFFSYSMSEKFNNDIKYEIRGNFTDSDKVLKIEGKATIFNNETSNDFFGKSYCQHPDFKIIGKGWGTITITMDNGNQPFKSESIFIDGPFEIEFGTGSSWEARENAVYIIKDSVSLTADKDPDFFYTDREYSVKVDFVGTFTVDEIDIGA